jgi:hypothetical protein
MVKIFLPSAEPAFELQNSGCRFRVVLPGFPVTENRQFCRMSAGFTRIQVVTRIFRPEDKFFSLSSGFFLLQSQSAQLDRRLFHISK